MMKRRKEYGYTEQLLWHLMDVLPIFRIIFGWMLLPWSIFIHGKSLLEHLIKSRHWIWVSLGFRKNWKPKFQKTQIFLKQAFKLPQLLIPGARPLQIILFWHFRGMEHVPSCRIITWRKLNKITVFILFFRFMIIITNALSWFEYFFVRFVYVSLSFHLWIYLIQSWKIKIASKFVSHPVQMGTNNSFFLCLCENINEHVY